MIPSVCHRVISIYVYEDDLDFQELKAVAAAVDLFVHLIECFSIVAVFLMYVIHDTEGVAQVEIH